MSDKYSVNEAFLRIYNSLIEKKAIRNKGELAGILGISPSTLSEIIAKRQGVTVEFIQKFCGSFSDVTPNDFFDTTSTLENTFTVSKDEFIELQRKALRQEDRIRELEKVVEELKKG